MNTTIQIIRKATIPAIILLAACAAQAVTVNVPGTSNPYLAGMPNGTGARDLDLAPAQSPVLAPVVLPSGYWVEFSNATGLVTNHTPYPDPDPTFLYDFQAGPEGYIAYVASHLYGAEHGKSDIWAPIVGLLGVFLDSSVPAAPPPPTLLFQTAAQRDYLTLSPSLKQVFYIGDGQAGGTPQKVYVPAGATRLYLGVMDGYNWYNNLGAFNVDVNVVPEPATMMLLAVGADVALLRRRHRS